MGLKNNILMDCKAATSVVEKKRDGKLTLSERIGLWIHMVHCSVCKLFFRQAEIIDRSYEYYADNIDLGDTVHPLDPTRKEAMNKSFKEELNKQ